MVANNRLASLLKSFRVARLFADANSKLCKLYNRLHNEECTMKSNTVSLWIELISRKDGNTPKYTRPIPGAWPQCGRVRSLFPGKLVQAFCSYRSHLRRLVEILACWNQRVISQTECGAMKASGIFNCYSSHQIYNRFSESCSTWHGLICHHTTDQRCCIHVRMSHMWLPYRAYAQIRLTLNKKKKPVTFYRSVRGQRFRGFAIGPFFKAPLVDSINLILSRSNW